MTSSVIHQPDVERLIDYRTHNRTVGKTRLRVWSDLHVAVLTELEHNPGMSITNAAEFAWHAADVALRHEQLSHPSWRLVEHYASIPSRQRPASYDMVTFAGRHDDGVFYGPQWAPLQRTDVALFAFLVEALS